MTYDFDQEISRKDTYSVKWEVGYEGDKLVQWDRTDKALGDERVLPLWVADMDFRCPQPVIDALVARAEHGIFGYAMKGHTRWISPGWRRSCAIRRSRWPSCATRTTR